MKLSNALQRIVSVIKEYIDKVIPTKLSDLEIDMELGAVKTVNGNEPDENGNVTVALIDHNHDISNVTDLQNTLDEINEVINDKSQVQMVTSESSDALSTLKIHRLTQDEYEQVVENGELDEHAIYLTPDEEIDLTPYATIKQLNEKAALEHNHDSLYDAKGSAEAVKQYIDSAVITKSQIQFITWEVDD